MLSNHLSPPAFPHSWASEWGEDQYGLWQAYVFSLRKPMSRLRPGIDPWKGEEEHRYIFRWIPPGSFRMGSLAPGGGLSDGFRFGDPLDGGERGRSEFEDRHNVIVKSGFWLGETTVTKPLWMAVMGLGVDPSRFKDEQRPVENVSWNDTDDFLERLSGMHAEFTVRLPREVEWEYACRAGTEYLFNFDEALSLEKVNYSGSWEADFSPQAKKETTDVKSYPSNAWGLYEMHGNVWEWCEDLWEPHLSDSEIQPVVTRRKVVQNRGMNYSVRGGSWRSPGGEVRSANRHYFEGDVRADDIGFRLAL